MTTIANAEGKFPTSWAADLLQDHTYVGRVTSMIVDGVHQLRIKTADGERVAARDSERGHTYGLDFIYGWVDEQMPRPRRTGRPAVGPQIAVSFPIDLLAQVDEAAAAAGMSRSAWIRQVCEDALG